MKLLEKVAKLFRPKRKDLKVVITTTMSNGKLVCASVDYLVDGRLVNIKTFSTFEEASSFYKLFTS